MIKLIATGMVTLAITFSGTPVPANASVVEAPQVAQTFIGGNPEILTVNTLAINRAIKKLNKTVGKTWYVFSGATPQGWDCSGLTMWFYEQVGIQLEHRASKQQSAGVAVKAPKVGDIVVFSYKGYKSAYHVGIYIGNGKMIHAPKHGHRTIIESIKQFGGNYSNISYRRIVDTI